MRFSQPPRTKRKALALAALAALALAGCVYDDKGAPPPRDRADTETTPEAPPPAPLPQFNLNVAEVQIISAYAAPPDSQAAVPFSPKAALELWAKTHVRAVGRQGQARIVIRDASITARRVDRSEGQYRDMFRRQPFERYEAVLELELQIRDDAGSVRAQIVARGAHQRFLMEDYRDYQAERTTQLQTLTDEIIAAALKRLETEVRATLGFWVR